MRDRETDEDRCAGDSEAKDFSPSDQGLAAITALPHGFPIALDSTQTRGEFGQYDDVNSGDASCRGNALVPRVLQFREFVLPSGGVRATRGTMLAASLVLLASCGQAPTPFPDYCEAQHRVIPRAERIAAALVYAAANGFEKQLPHFTAFRSKMAKTATERDIARAYLSKFPNCCAIAQPWVVEKYFDNASILGEHDAYDVFFDGVRDFKWSHDVVIFRNPPFSDEINPVRIQSSSCGNATNLGHG